MGQVFSDTINTGIYVIEPEALTHVPADRPYDFSKELFPLLLEMGRPIYGHVLDGYWQDIGNLDQFRQANFDALDGLVQLEIPGIRLRGNVWIGDSVGIDDVDHVEGPAFVGSNCRIAGDATVGAYTVLSNGVTLRDHARVARSVIDVGTHIGRSAVVEGAIIGRQCDIRDHVRLHEGVAIGDQVTVGPEASIFPGVRVYPFKEVETGAQIYESVIWESPTRTRLFGPDGVAGLVNVDLTAELAVRLAAALGTALDRGTRVVASRESPDACRMIQRAVIAGLTSTGVHVADLRVSPSAVTRHVLKTQGLAAGVHVAQSALDPEQVQIRIFESPGIQLTWLCRRRSRSISPARSYDARRSTRWVRRPTRRACARATCRTSSTRRHRGDPRTRLSHRRRLRLLRRHSSSRSSSARWRSTPSPPTASSTRRELTAHRSISGRLRATARHGRCGRSRRRLRPCRRAAVPRRRAR